MEHGWKDLDRWCTHAAIFSATSAKMTSDPEMAKLLDEAANEFQQGLRVGRTTQHFVSLTQDYEDLSQKYTKPKPAHNAPTPISAKPSHAEPSPETSPETSPPPPPSEHDEIREKSYEHV